MICCPDIMLDWSWWVKRRNQ